MAVPIFKAYTGLIYTPRSGGFDFAERVSYSEELQGTYADARTYGDAHHRGSLWTFTGLAGVFCVEQASVNSERGGIGTVTVKYVWLNSVPPDEWSVTPFEINPPIERTNTFSALTLDDKKAARKSFLMSQAEGQISIDTAIAARANATLIILLVNKWYNGEETFYMAGLKYQWTTFFTTLSGVILRRGGYIETPGGPGSFPGNFAWLRQADELVWNNGLYRLTRSWIGAPDSITYWDTDIYGSAPI